MRQTRTAVTTVLIALCLVSTGCTATHMLPVPSATTEPSRLPTPGNKVVVTLQSGEIRRFRLEAVEADALKGKDISVPFTDIEKLQETQFSMKRTSNLVFGTLAAIAAAIYIPILAGAYGHE